MTILEVIEAAVRAELGQRRTSARVQAFVPIFAERAARQRLAGVERSMTPIAGQEAPAGAGSQVETSHSTG